MHRQSAHQLLISVAATIGLLLGGPAAGRDLIYFSTLGNSSVPGVPDPFDDADIYRFDVDTGEYDRVFDARNAGLPGNADIDALHVIDPVTFILSFGANAGTVVPGLGTVMDEDLVVYHAGKFGWFMRGLDVGLGDDGNAEDIDAIHVLSEGSVLISTTGAPKVGVSGARPQDVLRCDGVFGAVASCNWSMYLDGSTVGLSTSDENVDALFELGGAPYLSTKGPFSVPGLSGDNSDVARCDPDSSGAPIHCASFTTFFDGSSSGLADDLDAAHFSPDAFADPNPAEFRVVILGASTAAGVGASSPAASWAGLLDAWLGTVTASHQMINLAVGNLTTESSRADGSMPVPDPNHNITRVLELNPDLIILNFGASDVAQGIPIATSIAYYQEMKAAADLLGIPLFLTTTQPRNFTLAKRTVLRDEAIAVRATFGAIVIDIYDELADSNDLRLKTIYDSGDGKHPNDAGHNYLFETVRDKIATLVPP